MPCPQHRPSFIGIGLFLAVVLSLPPGPAHGASVDHGLYAQLLERYVKDGVVDYSGFQKERRTLEAYLDLLAEIDTDTLTPDEQFAFFVNAYNAWTIWLILTKYPNIESIKDLGSLFKSPWKMEIARIDGELMSLDHIEHGILRKRFPDPRVHFAVNCASKSCPPLLSEPYRGATLDRQLDGATRDFINDPENNRLEGDTLYVSKIFDWYGEDFDGEIVGFFLRYARADLKRRLEQNRDRIDVKYLDYDWSLNGY